MLSILKRLKSMPFPPSDNWEKNLDSEFQSLCPPPSRDEIKAAPDEFGNSICQDSNHGVEIWVVGLGEGIEVANIVPRQSELIKNGVIGATTHEFVEGNRRGIVNGRSAKTITKVPNSGESLGGQSGTDPHEKATECRNDDFHMSVSYAHTLALPLIII
jgi:hypothetical protein